MGQDSYIKIEWAKDYFGPDVVMAKQNDNVAQLCYYFRHVKEIIAWAKELNVGDTRVPDDEYVLLYEDEIAKCLASVKTNRFKFIYIYIILLLLFTCYLCFVLGGAQETFEAEKDKTADECYKSFISSHYDTKESSDR